MTNEIERGIFLKPPPEFNDGSLWKLKKTIYGLCDAARAWYLRVKQELLELGMIMAASDSTIFSYFTGESLEGLICIYVDDFLWVGTPLFKSRIIDQIGKAFQVGNFSTGIFKYIGLNICSGDKEITVDQIHYGSSMNLIAISPARANNKKGDLTEAEKSDYRSLVGQLNWMAIQTRPDIAFDTCVLSSLYAKATVGDMLNVNKVAKRVKGDCFRLSFPAMESMEQCHLACYSDASLANLPSGGSQGGMLVLLRDSKGNQCPLYWQTKRVRRVVNSTLAA